MRLRVMRDQLHADDPTTGRRYKIVFPGDPANDATAPHGRFHCGTCACKPCNSGSKNKCTPTSRADGKAGGIWRPET